MSYSGGVFGATDEMHLIPALPAPTAPIRQTAAPSVMAPAPYRAAPSAAKLAADAERPTSIVSSES